MVTLKTNASAPQLYWLVLDSLFMHTYVYMLEACLAASTAYMILISIN